MEPQHLTHLAELGELFLVDPVLVPVSLVAAVHVDRDGVFVGAHHPLDVVLFKGARKLGVGVGAVLQTEDKG